MTEQNPQVDNNVDGFFDQGGSGGAPSAKLSQPNDFVIGKVVDQYKVDKKKFNSDDLEKDRDGNPIKQLVVILQTDRRNWDGVAKVPYVDLQDKSKGQKAPELDDGKRALYVAPWTNLFYAVRDALQAHGAKGFAIGAEVAVKVDHLEPTDSGNPKKVHVVRYTPPSASDAFFGQGQAQSAPPTQQAPAPAAQPAPQAAPAAQPQGDPWVTQPQAAQPAGDPWGNPSQGAQPPF